MSEKKKVTPKQLLNNVSQALKKVKPYSLLIFLVFVVALYGIVFLKINQLTNAQPSSDAVSSQVKAAKLTRIDPAVLDKLQSLQDNSVSVQSLFEQARNNPFN